MPSNTLLSSDITFKIFCSGFLRTTCGDTCFKKYVKKVGNTNYEIYCLHCNLLAEPVAVGAGDTDRIRQRRLTRRPAEALEPSQSICFSNLHKKKLQMLRLRAESNWKKNKKTADAFTFPPPPLLQVVANGFLQCQVTLLEC